MLFSLRDAASIGIIGGADGPTAIFVTSILSPELLGAVAVAAYSYMALVPIIQPPIVRLLTTPDERRIVMQQLRPVSRVEKILFPLLLLVLVGLLLPSAAPRQPNHRTKFSHGVRGCIRAGWVACSPLGQAGEWPQAILQCKSLAIAVSRCRCNVVGWPLAEQWK